MSRKQTNNILYVTCLVLWVSPCLGVDFVVRQLASPDAPFSRYRFAELSGELFFSASGPLGEELYKTDGTNVSLVADIAMPTEEDTFGDSSPGVWMGFTELAGHLYFDARGPQGTELYRTNGSEVELVHDINPAGGSFPGGGGFDRIISPGLPEYAGELFFPARGPAGTELYKTNGETTTLFDINPLGDSELGSGSFPHKFTEFSGQLFFVANGPAGNELYKTNGVDVSLVTDINPGSADSNPGFGIPGLPNTAAGVKFKGELFFPATGPNGRELYKTDGEMVTLVHDVNPEGDSFANYDAFLGVLNDHLYFNALGRLYKTDGTTVSLLDINPGGESEPDLSEAAVYADHLFFDANGPEGHGLYKTDGDKVTRMTSINGDDIPFARHFVEFNGELYFTAGFSGHRFYRTDGDIVGPVADGEREFKEVDSGFVEFAGELLFRAEDGPKGPGVYKTNGTEITFVDANISSRATHFAGELYVGRQGGLSKITIGGDANEDGKVEFSDFLVLADNFGQLGGWTDGDFDLNGQIEFADFVILSNNFGAMAESTGTPQVPEPNCGCLVLFAAVCLPWVTRSIAHDRGRYQAPSCKDAHP